MFIVLCLMVIQVFLIYLMGIYNTITYRSIIVDSIRGMLATLTFQHSLTLTLLLDEINVCLTDLCRFNFQNVNP